MSCLKLAHTAAVWRIPKLMLHAPIWLRVILPFVRRNHCRGKYLEMVQRTTDGFINDWTTGAINPQQQKLNQHTCDIDDMHTDGRVAIAEDLTRDLLRGRIIPYLGTINGKLLLFAAPKKLCPITDVPIKWRVIRDGSCGSQAFPSINQLTPNCAAEIRLINRRIVISYVKIMSLLYGPGILLGKADLDGAFRQFYLAKSETSQIVYEYAGLTLGDTQNIWGTRSGSRICQDFTQVSARYFALNVNGLHLARDVDAAIEHVDIQHFECLLQLHRRVPVLPSDSAYTLDARVSASSKPIALDHTQLLHWSATTVQMWLSSHGLAEANDILQIRNGLHLIRCHIGYVRRWHTATAVKRLQCMSFFDALLDLKIRSRARCCACSSTATSTIISSFCHRNSNMLATL